MNQLVQHTKIVIKMYNNKIDMRFLREMPLNKIVDCLENIEEKSINYNEYENNLKFQRELIRDNKFIKYLDIAYKRNYDIYRFETLLEQIKEHDKKMSDYSISEIFITIKNKNLKNESMYDFLNNFIKEDYKTRKIAAKNLNYFFSQEIYEFKDISEEEINLLKTHLLDDYNLIPKEHIKEVYKLLANNKELVSVIDFLYLYKLNLPLSIENYEEINKNPKQILDHIEQIYNIINNNDVTYKMLLKWIHNNCSLYDLKTILRKIQNLSENDLNSIFSNQSSYINFIYGNKLTKFPTSDLYGDKEELIIYAIREDKKSFLRLIEENMETFFDISVNSILFNKSFYTKYINLNELTIKHLERLRSMLRTFGASFNSLKEKNYTFEEIATLYNAKKQYITLYNEMLDLKVDERLLRIRQLIKKDLLSNITDDDDIFKLAEKIKIKPLYLWIEKDFKNIKELACSDALQILIHYDDLQKFIPEINNSFELAYLLRNCEKLSKYENLENIKNDIQNIDEFWIRLKQELEFNEEFLQKNKINIEKFLLKNGAELAYKYYISRNGEEKKSFKLIIKAELMGEFKSLKYHTDDLKKEIDFELFDYQIKEWTEENSNISEKEFYVGEYDDFYNTMILGEKPTVTCLSYKSGSYNTCLLACFDSNKKILYAKSNGIIVARAMVRLTKGTFDKNNGKELSFVDVETGSKTNTIKEEMLTLFLERPYIAGLSNDEAHRVKKMFIKLLETKAEKMNALLVLSKYYTEEIEDGFVSTEYSMYISRSKSSSQYLDSLSGKATISDERQYKQNLFLIWKDSLKKMESYEKRLVA